MDIKLIGIDLDGTLLSPDGSISEANREALRYAAQKGAMPVICTGRMYVTAHALTQGLGLKTPIVACNGAELRDESQTYHRSEMHIEDVALSLEAAHRFGNYPILCNGHRMYVEEAMAGHVMDVFGAGHDETDYYAKVRDREALLDVARSDGAIKVVIVTKDDKAIAQTRSYLDARLNGRFSVSSSWGSSLDVVNAEVDKGRGLLLLAQRLGVLPQEIMAIGDNENDVPMFEIAGVSVAMGNAHDAVKALADEVTLSNLEDGFAAAVMKLV